MIPTAPALGPQISGAQGIFTSTGSIYLSSPLKASYQSYRTIRKDPTVALARALSVAPIMAAAWSVESDDDVEDSVVQFISEQMLPKRISLLESALYSQIDFGHFFGEKIFYADEAGRVGVQIKPLLPDITSILINSATGDFAGFRQLPMTEVSVEFCLLLSRAVEGQNWYGESLLENIRLAYNAYAAAEAGAARYSKRIAGSTWLVYYPVGTSLIAGVETANSTVAQSLLATLEASGSVALPNSIMEYVSDLNVQAAQHVGWRIELVTDGGGKEANFIDRLTYLDTLKVRGLLLPERTILEGSHGTLAEATVHANAALQYMEHRHTSITSDINEQLVNHLLVLNYGPSMKGKVRLVAGPIIDENRNFQREIAKALIRPEHVDLDSLLDSLGLPKSEEVVQSVPVQETV